MAGKLGRPETSEPTPTEGDKSFGEALKEMGFLPMPGAKWRIIRQGSPINPLTLEKGAGSGTVTAPGPKGAGANFKADCVRSLVRTLSRPWIIP